MIIAKRCGTAKLRHGRCPQIVRALHHFRDFRGDFIGVLHRQQVRAHGLVDAGLLDAVLPHLHQLAGLGANALLHPLPHARAAHGCQHTARHLTHHDLYVVQFLRGILNRRTRQGHVQHDATVVDALVDIVVGQFLVV